MTQLVVDLSSGCDVWVYFLVSSQLTNFNWLFLCDDLGSLGGGGEVGQ